MRVNYTPELPTREAARVNAAELLLELIDMRWTILRNGKVSYVYDNQSDAFDAYNKMKLRGKYNPDEIRGGN